MTLLIFAFIILLVAGLFIWAIGRAPIDANFKWIAQAIVAVIAALVILQRAGVIGG